MLKIASFIACSSISSLLFAGCDMNIDIGSDGTVYSQGHQSLRYGRVQSDGSIRQSTQITGSGVSLSSNRVSVAGIQQSSQATYDKRWDAYPNNETAAYQPCQQYPESYKRQ